MFKVSILSLFFFYCHLLLKNLKRLRSFQRSYGSLVTQSRYQKYTSLLHRLDLSDQTLIFHVEETLLKSCSLFHYFMLVAFEAGGLLRATILLLLYPAICLVSDEVGLRMIVMVCFFGIKKETFRAGRAVLPKFFLEDVGLEMFEVLKKCRKKVAITNLPRIMIESFLQEYLEWDHVIARELKVFGGYFTGLMEENTKDVAENMQESTGCNAIGIAGFNKIPDHELFSRCKDMYLVTEADKRIWKNLPREKYPKDLIFHDGRLSQRPTPLETLATLMWIPFAFLISIVRITLALFFPYDLSTPLLCMTGLRLHVVVPQTSLLSFSNTNDKSKGHLFVCNHKTLLDPLYLAFTLKKNLIAVTYSLSRMSEILAPIKTVRLTRNRDEDAKMMKKLLNEGDLAVCPEGTTCREPYLLRFSPLFSEMCDEIIPVAIDTHVSMFHGTTAGGLKCLDPIFFLMNPTPVYTVQVLDKVSSGSFTSTENDHKSRFDVANHVQSQLAKALSFKCTKLTRKDKYMILAGNQGIVSTK